MYVKGDLVIIETNRWFTGYEAMELKNEWERTLGHIKDGCRMDLETRTVHVTAVTEKVPPDAKLKVWEKDPPPGHRGHVWYKTYPGAKQDEFTAMDEYHDSLQIMVMRPSVDKAKSWVGTTYTDVKDEWTDPIDPKDIVGMQINVKALKTRYE